MGRTSVRSSNHFGCARFPLFCRAICGSGLKLHLSLVRASKQSGGKSALNAYSPATRLALRAVVRTEPDTKIAAADVIETTNDAALNALQCLEFADVSRLGTLFVWRTGCCPEIHLRNAPDGAAAAVKVCGWRPDEGRSARAGGRRTQTSRGGNRGRFGVAARQTLWGF